MRYLLGAVLLVLVFLGLAGTGALVERFFPSLFLFSDPAFIDYVLVGEGALLMVCVILFAVWVLSEMVEVFLPKKGV